MIVLINLRNYDDPCNDYIQHFFHVDFNHDGYIDGDDIKQVLRLFCDGLPELERLQPDQINDIVTQIMLEGLHVYMYIYGQ